MTVRNLTRALLLAAGTMLMAAGGAAADEPAGGSGLVGGAVAGAGDVVDDTVGLVESVAPAPETIRPAAEAVSAPEPAIAPVRPAAPMVARVAAPIVEADAPALPAPVARPSVPRQIEPTLPAAPGPAAPRPAAPDRTALTEPLLTAVEPLIPDAKPMPRVLDVVLPVVRAVAPVIQPVVPAAAPVATPARDLVAPVAGAVAHELEPILAPVAVPVGEIVGPAIGVDLPRVRQRLPVDAPIARSAAGTTHATEASDGAVAPSDDTAQAPVREAGVQAAESPQRIAMPAEPHLLQVQGGSDLVAPGQGGGGTDRHVFGAPSSGAAPGPEGGHAIALLASLLGLLQAARIAVRALNHARPPSLSFAPAVPPA